MPLSVKLQASIYQTVHGIQNLQQSKIKSKARSAIKCANLIDSTKISTNNRGNQIVACADIPCKEPRQVLCKEFIYTCRIRFSGTTASSDYRNWSRYGESLGLPSRPLYKISIRAIMSLTSLMALYRFFQNLIIKVFSKSLCGMWNWGRFFAPAVCLYVLWHARLSVSRRLRKRACNGKKSVSWIGKPDFLRLVGHF